VNQYVRTYQVLLLLDDRVESALCRARPLLHIIVAETPDGLPESVQASGTAQLPLVAVLRSAISILYRTIYCSQSDGPLTKCIWR
jgi:hypothetical protein